MLTPRFELSQDENFIKLTIHCPYIKAENAEIDISGQMFRFYCKPYFLRLSFPAALVENGREKSSYDLDSGNVYLDIPKEVPGEHFADLDLLTKLLDMKVIPKPLQSGSLIQSLDTDTEEDISGGDTDDISWHFNQVLPVTNSGLTASYGFNNMYKDCGSNISELVAEYMDIDNVDTTTPLSRREMRLTAEDKKFDAEYYMYDFCMNEEIKLVLDFRPNSWKVLKNIQQHSGISKDSFEFSNQEKEELVKLPNKEYLIDSNMVAPIYLGLVDLILTYCYDFRSNLGDESVESHWNICKLSGTLSAFDTFYSLEDVIKCFLRRSVSFPLYRSYDLFLKVLEDAVILFKLGKRYLLQTLLRIKRILACHEATFVIDRIYLTDYAVWIQTASEKKLKSLASELHRFTPSKELSDWNLHELEQEALRRKEECDYPV